MTPAQCRTKAQAVTSALAIYEARVTALRVTGRLDSPVDAALFKLEHEYWKRADELGKKPKKRRRKKRGGPK